MAKHCIIGHKGFLGSALAKRLEEYTPYPTDETKVIFYFGSVTHIPFEENPSYHIHRVLSDFLYLLPLCQERGIKFVYASSALLYEPEKDIAFSRCKKMLELLASCFPNTLGLRIFPVYGPGGASAISQWCKDIKNKLRPVIYGDGTQKRDFIYIDDVVDQVLTLAENSPNQVEDVGAGQPTSFNDIVAIINDVLEEEITPIYTPAPPGYSPGIACAKPLPINTPLREGIEKICEAL